MLKYEMDGLTVELSGADEWLEGVLIKRGFTVMVEPVEKVAEKPKAKKTKKAE